MTYCQQFTIADAHYQISTSSPSIARHLSHIFSGFLSTLSGASVTTSFVIDQNADQTISVRPRVDFPPKVTSVDEFVSLFEWHLVREAFDQMPYIGIHSGGVICHGKTILFPGQSGYGKSTLTLGCVLKGSAFLSDEMAFVEPGTSHAFSFPRVLCIKNDAQIFQALDVRRVLQQPDIIRPLNNSLCVSPRSFECVPQHQPCPVDAIVFPHFQPDQKTSLLPISPRDSLTELIGLSYKRTQSPRILDTLGQLVENAPSYKLTMNHLPDAVQEVENLAI
jgi:hypothetical protein